MKTTYLIWKSSPNEGVAPDWQEITGKEFLALVRSPQGKGRHFIKLPSTDPDGKDGAVVMETTRANYLDWKREKNRADYLRTCGKDTTVVSYHAMESDDGEYFGEELLPDYDSDAENKYIKVYRLEMALAVLTDEERQLVEHLYLSDKQGTIRSYEALTGIPKSTVNRRQKAVLEKLKKFFQD